VEDELAFATAPALASLVAAAVARTADGEQAVIASTGRVTNSVERIDLQKLGTRTTL
jgi:hypothetical protein